MKFLKQLWLSTCEYMINGCRNSLIPHSQNEDIRRREFIFTLLLLALFILTLTSALIAFIHSILEDYSTDESAVVLLIPLLVLIVLYRLSRQQFHDWQVWLFLGLYILLGTYALYSCGYILPEGLLTYVLVIVMAGALLSIRASLVVSGIIAICLGALTYCQLHRIIKLDLSRHLKILNIENVILYTLFFMIITLVSWLSSRELSRSLERARRTERMLWAERNLLEKKVAERTRQIEKSQIEKIQELQRFAEFGRLTSSLVHDLVNPLTSASLEIDQISGQPTRHNLQEIRKSIRAMERYVEASRRQLCQESEVTIFKVADEIRHVQEFLKSKVRASGIHFKSQLVEHVHLRGDPVRFNQIIANLFANAIDAYDNSEADGNYIAVTMRLTAQFVIITVEDHGVGIAETKLPHIFDPFYTTKASNRGTGIGLTITRQTLERDFRGTITATSLPDKGTCFTVTLPRA